MITKISNFEKKKALVLAGYSNDFVVKKYKLIGLTVAEKKIIKTFFPPPPCKVLDIGCGAGRTSFPLSEMGYDVIAIDLVYRLIKEAKKIQNSYEFSEKAGALSFKVMDALDMKFKAENFDACIFSFNGIEHIPTIIGKSLFLRSLHKVLKKSGRFIFTVHSGLPFNRAGFIWLRTFFSFYSNRILNKKQHADEFGERFYNPEIPESKYTHIISIFKMKKLLKESGFSLLYCNSQKNIDKNKKANILSNFHFGNIFICSEKR